jgi:hypothetical protein
VRATRLPWSPVPLGYACTAWLPAGAAVAGLSLGAAPAPAPAAVRPLRVCLCLRCIPPLSTPPRTPPPSPPPPPRALTSRKRVLFVSVTDAGGSRDRTGGGGGGRCGECATNESCPCWVVRLLPPSSLPPPPPSPSLSCHRWRCRRRASSCAAIAGETVVQGLRVSEFKGFMV